MKAFKDFPATIGCALGFTLVTMIRIQLDWPQQEPYNFLFNSLHWSFALGAIFSLMAITGAKSIFNTTKSFIIANILGIIKTVFAFLLLYYFAGTDQRYVQSRYEVVSALAVARVSMGILVSYLIFIVLSGLPFERSVQIEKQDNIKTKKNQLQILDIDFSKAFFMSHKAFFIAIIYGIVIMSGATGVARAIQALLYQQMSSKVYMYIGAIAGFMAFTVFVGYFPDFEKGKNDEHRLIAEKQPKFVEILLGYIMVPLMIALTIVLLLWAGRTVINGMDVSFIRLSGIAASYTIGGIWLHIMVSGHNTGLTKFYRRLYPFAAIIILLFEAWAVVNQLNKSGLKLTEYWFILVWIVAVVGAVLMIVFKSKSYIFIVATICILAIFSVLPFVGYNVLPVKAQANRLETLLINEDMLQGDTIVAAKTEPELEVREAITDAVDYLAYANDAKLPSWFDRELLNDLTFRKTFGFDKIWPKDDFGPQPSNYTGISLYLPSDSIDISEYHWAINIQQAYEKTQSFITVDGVKGTYRIYWESVTGNSIPSLEIQLNNKTIIQKDMNEFIDNISEKYPSTNMQPKAATVEDMTMVLESEEIKVLLVFRNLEINIDPQNDNIYYGINLESIYMLEKI